MGTMLCMITKRLLLILPVCLIIFKFYCFSNISKGSLVSTLLETSAGISQKNWGSDVEMFEILYRDWNLKRIFIQKWASVDMN